MNAILLRQAKAAQASLLSTTLAGMEKMLREQLEEQARTLPRSPRATEAQQVFGHEDSGLCCSPNVSSVKETII